MIKIQFHGSSENCSISPICFGLARTNGSEKKASYTTNEKASREKRHILYYVRHIVGEKQILLYETVTVG